jgi:ABC-type amino acid transport substrate-binding protein
MKNALLVILAVILALVVQNLAFTHTMPPIPVAAEKIETIKTETAYDRVMRTNTLRCAYGLYPPWIGKDPNTGKLNGIMPDIMAAFEQASGIKVEWGPEIDWGNIAVTLQSGKADAFCAGMFMTPKRGRVIAAATPLFFSVMQAFARSDDKRFEGNIDRINQPDVRISVNMGDISEEMAQRIFPQAQLVYKSSVGGEAELFLNVATNKADIALSGPSNLSTYNLSNPSTALRQVELQNPVMIFRNIVGVDIHELTLLQTINATLYNLIDSGAIDKILRANTGKDYGVSYFPPKAQSG